MSKFSLSLHTYKPSAARLRASPPQLVHPRTFELSKHVEEFHQANQETFIWLLAVGVEISYSLPTCISNCKELVA
jgi:hypothetical protein